MTDTILDFNTAPRQRELTVIDNIAWEARLDRLRDELRGRAADLTREIFPRARIHAGEARIGDLDGSDGESLAIQLTGDRAGLWHDHATGEGGDLIDLWRATQNYAASEFKRAVEDLEHHLGLAGRPAWTSPVRAVAQQRQKAAAALPKPDHSLGPPVASYHYYSAAGALIGIVRRYHPGGVDEATGKPKKTFRPFTADGAPRMPDPRPLYRLPKITTASVVVLVEGEKCADALETVGVESTTAMGGAKADPAKTDWTPLAGKTVLVWEDNDAAGAGLIERVKPHLEAIGCTVAAIAIPPGKPAKWDAADAVEAGEDIPAIIAGAAPPPAGSVYRVLTIDELATLKPPEWRIDGIFPVYGSSTIYGAFESFKTFAALDMLLPLAVGMPWLGREVKKTSVLYIAGEGQHGLAQRILGWCEARNEGRRPAGFRVLPEAVAIPVAGSLDKLLRTIDALPEPPGVVVLDTITRMSGGGSLNDEKDMQQYVMAMDRLRLHTGGHVMNVGHSGKDREKGLLGSTVLPAAMETIICVERKGDRLTLINSNPKGKQKDGPNFDDIRLKTALSHFTQAGAASSTLVLLPDDEPETSLELDTAPGRPQGAVQTAIMTSLRKAKGAPLGVLRLSGMVGKDIKTIERALSPLSAKGLIKQEGNGWVLV